LVFEDDPRILNGTLKISNKKKKIYAYDSNDKRHIINEDDFDPTLCYRIEKNHKKCKDDDGNIFTLYMTNSRIVNNKVLVASFATNGSETFLVFPDDPRILNGTLKFVKNKKKIHIYDNNDKRHIINEDDYDPDKFFRLPDRHKKCKDSDGNIFTMSKNHKKIKNGEVSVAQYATDGKDFYLVFEDDPRILNGTLQFK
jgi:hypothetical protein